jgi:4-hydroxyproline epimerase
VRRALCHEPRGHEAMVGALICPPSEATATCGVIFFNNVGTLQMCVHGTIGLIATLAHLGKIEPGPHRIETPAGPVLADLAADGSVAVTNVPARRLRHAVEIDVPGHGPVRGDVAWGGNWFFLIDGRGPAVDFANLAALTAFAREVRRALAAAGVTGTGGAEIDHIEVFGPPGDPTFADSRNFVLCPGFAYDRSPCGTGTSAKLACLHADGRLAPGQVWRQAGIRDTVFEGSFEPAADGAVVPRIRGSAFITAESTYLFNPDDPFQYGIPIHT